MRCPFLIIPILSQVFSTSSKMWEDRRIVFPLLFSFSTSSMKRISINLLCNTAGYNRATFYNHFKNIYDLQERAIEEIFLPIREKVLAEKDIRILLQENTDIVENLFLPCFMQNNTYIELLFRRKDYYLVGEWIKKELLKHLETQYKDSAIDFGAVELLLEYHVSAVLGVINYWYRQGKVLSDQCILDKIYDISMHGVLNELKNEIDRET